MKKFRFPLRSVAVLRSYQELRAREAFAGAVRAHAAAELHQAEARARVSALEATGAARRRERHPAAEAANFLRAYRAECAGEAEAGRQVAVAAGDLRTSRAAYLEAHRRLRILQRLEEKARAVHRRESAAAEQAELDELARFRSTRQPAAAP
jgi:flagellar FliJ protein